MAGRLSIACERLILTPARLGRNRYGNPFVARSVVKGYVLGKVCSHARAPGSRRENLITGYLSLPGGDEPDKEKKENLICRLYDIQAAKTFNFVNSFSEGAQCYGFKPRPIGLDQGV